MQIILDISGKGFELTEDGYAMLFKFAVKEAEGSNGKIQCSYLRTITDTFKENILKCTSDVHFRMNKTLINAANEYEMKMIKNRYIIAEIDIPNGISKCTDRLQIVKDSDGIEMVVYIVYHPINDDEYDDY